MNSFTQMIKAGIIKRRDTGMYIDLANIHVEEGFNIRDKESVDPSSGLTYDQYVDELAAYLGDGGKVQALEVRPRGDDPKEGVWLVDGHCRTDAYNRLKAAGKLPADPKDGHHWIKIDPFEGNDAERTARTMSSQNNRKLTDLEKCEGLRRLRAFGWSQQQMAKHVGMSPANVSRLLTLADAPAQVQQLVKSGNVKSTTATKAVKQHGDKSGKVLLDAVQKMQDALAKQPKGSAAKPSKPVRVTAASLEQPKSPWIKTDGTTPLPKEGYEVLIFLREGEVRRRVAKIDSDEKGTFWLDEAADETFELAQVSHFTYIPAEPQD